MSRCGSLEAQKELHKVVHRPGQRRSTEQHSKSRPHVASSIKTITLSRLTYAYGSCWPLGVHSMMLKRPSRWRAQRTLACTPKHIERQMVTLMVTKGQMVAVVEINRQRQTALAERKGFNSTSRHIT